eukprot:1597046-Prymnesium_polylepis.2
MCLGRKRIPYWDGGAIRADEYCERCCAPHLLPLLAATLLARRRRVSDRQLLFELILIFIVLRPTVVGTGGSRPSESKGYPAVSEQGVPGHERVGQRERAEEAEEGRLGRRRSSAALEKPVPCCKWRRRKDGAVRGLGEGEDSSLQRIGRGEASFFRELGEGRAASSEDWERGDQFSVEERSSCMWRSSCGHGLATLLSPAARAACRRRRHHRGRPPRRRRRRALPPSCPLAD